jgi:hypothetical protein
MADSIKVQTMRRLADILGAIPEIGSVHRWQGRPIDLDHVKTPALFLWEEDETREKRNRLALGIVKMYLGVFIRLSPAGASSFNDLGDNIQGKIYNALAVSVDLGEVSLNYQEERVWKEFPNDEYGVLYMSFILTYGHAWGDAFTTAY